MQPFLLLKTLSFLVGIIALMYLCIHLYKRKLHRNRQSERRIKLVEQHAIDQRTSINLVRIDDSEMIIVTHQNAIVLHRITEADRRNQSPPHNATCLSKPKTTSGWPC